MIQIGTLSSDVSVIVRNLQAGVSVLIMLLGEIFAVRQSRQLLRRQRMLHRLCRSHG